MQQITHSQTIISLKNVSYSYGHTLAIKDVTLDIHKGDYLGIVGPNGGGKSTILKLIVGLLTPQSGKVSLFNTPIEKFKDASKLGYVSQQVTHIDENFPLSVNEVVMMGRFPKLGIFKMPTKEDAATVSHALQQVEMLTYRHTLIGDLSGGQQQRVFIARALAGQPEIIVLDEPTVGVDEKTQKQFYTLLQKLNRELNLTLILVSHELDMVAHEATEIAYVNRELVYHGIPNKFLHSEYFEKLTGKGVHTDA